MKSYSQFLEEPVPINKNQSLPRGEFYKVYCNDDGSYVKYLYEFIKANFKQPFPNEVKHD